MSIDVHAHFFPSSILSQVEGREKALGVSCDPSTGVLTFPSGPSRPLFPGLTDLDSRRAWKAEKGIARQVVSPWMDVAGDDLEGTQAAAWAALYNDGTAAELSGDRTFMAFATLPAGDGGAAARELDRCVRNLGFVGGALPTQVGGANLSEAGLDPLFEAAESLGVPLFLHPFRVLGADRLARDFMTNICGNPFETTVAAMDLFFSGTLERYPRLRILLSHCGGTLPLIAGRAAQGSRSNPAARRKMAAPEEILAAFYYDTVLHDLDALAFSIRRVGPQRCALGSDAPFPMALDEPVDHVAAALGRAGLGDRLDQVVSTTAAAFLPDGMAVLDELH